MKTSMNPRQICGFLAETNPSLLLPFWFTSLFLFIPQNRTQKN